MPAGLGQTTYGDGQPLDFIPVIASDFRLLRDETGVMRNSATNMTLEPHTGPNKRVINYDRVEAADVADAVDINQAQTLSDTATVYTPSEVAVQVVLPGSTMRRYPDADLVGRTTRMLNNAYDLKEDADGASQLTSFTPILGSAGAVISPGHAYAAGGRLRIGNDRANPEPTAPPWMLILHPMQGVVLEGRLIPFASTPAGAAAFGAAGGAHAGVTVPGGIDAEGRRMINIGVGAVGTIAQMVVKYDANISVDGNDDASGAGYGMEHLVYVSEVEPRLDPDDSDKSMRGAVELNLWGSYDWGTYRPGVGGVEMLFDASLPTS